MRLMHRESYYSNALGFGVGLEIEFDNIHGDTPYEIAKFDRRQQGDNHSTEEFYEDCHARFAIYRVTLNEDDVDDCGFKLAPVVWDPIPTKEIIDASLRSMLIRELEARATQAFYQSRQGCPPGQVIEEYVHRGLELAGLEGLLRYGELIKQVTVSKPGSAVQSLMASLTFSAPKGKPPLVTAYAPSDQETVRSLHPEPKTVTYPRKKRSKTPYID